MAKITEIKARMILDSRGNPTIEADLFSNKVYGRAAVPSGASKGIHEALELRDNKKEYLGKGVTVALNNIKKIKKKIKGMNPEKQENIDKAMITLDGTKNKSRLGANAILAVSLANARLSANIKKISLYKYIAKLAENRDIKLPIPMANIINGGVHAGNELKIQEFMICPLKAKSFSEATRIVSEIYNILKELIKEKYGKIATAVGDEGGFAPPLKNAEEALQLLEEVIQKSGYYEKVRIAIDAASSEFYKGGYYEIEKERRLDRTMMIKYWLSLLKNHPLIFSLEDPFAEDDYDSWKIFMQELERNNIKILVVGDDLTVSNPSRIEFAIRNKLCNTLLLKVNQIGTLTEAIEAANSAKKGGWHIIVSHRSGETEDSFISDLSVGLGTGLIKLGAPCRGERTVKYNQLLRIEEGLVRKKYGLEKESFIF